jgi:RimJ/RimL family protein N-acetyltransferase
VTSAIFTRLVEIQAATRFVARLSAEGAELGVATPPRFRGRGYAQATTAAWAAFPTLSSRDLFYSTELTNLASRRVAARLGLPLVGAGAGRSSEAGR